LRAVFLPPAHRDRRGRPASVAAAAGCRVVCLVEHRTAVLSSLVSMLYRQVEPAP
jgi:hypothetical protein